MATANNVVESISQLSASTREVTAGAEQADGLSSENLSVAKETKAAMTRIEKAAEGLKEYL